MSFSLGLNSVDDVSLCTTFCNTIFEKSPQLSVGRGHVLNISVIKGTPTFTLTCSAFLSKYNFLFFACNRKKFLFQ